MTLFMYLYGKEASDLPDLASRIVAGEDLLLQLFSAPTIDKRRIRAVTDKINTNNAIFNGAAHV